MKRSGRSALLFATLLAALPAVAGAQTPEPSDAPAAADGLTAQDREILASAQQTSAEISQIVEGWIASKAITEDKLFARLYYPIPKTDPVKYTTDYDALSDRDVAGVQEKALSRSSALEYVVLVDINGYLPTHNSKFAQPLTGNLAVDLVNNRTKRIFGDRTGITAARNTQPYLLQRYKRDTGELMADLSVPVMVRGKHFGALRFGYRRDAK